MRNISYLEVTPNTPLSTNIYKVEFYLIGDTKGLFQLLGRSGFDSSYCLFCQSRPKTWKELCGNRSSNYELTCVRANAWTIEEINEVALTQFQKMSSGQTFASVGVRGCVSIKNMPINRVLPPMLHLLLGLGNDICSHFKSFLSERIEQLSQ